MFGYGKLQAFRFHLFHFERANWYGHKHGLKKRQAVCPTVLFVHFSFAWRARRNDKLCQSAVGTTFQWLRTMSFTFTVTSADEHDANNRSKRQRCSLFKRFSIELNDFIFMTRKCMLLEIQSAQCFMHRINLNATEKIIVNTEKKLLLLSMITVFTHTRNNELQKNVIYLQAHLYPLKLTSCK